MDENNELPSLEVEEQHIPFIIEPRKPGPELKTDAERVEFMEGEIDRVFRENRSTLKWLSIVEDPEMFRVFMERACGDE